MISKIESLLGYDLDEKQKWIIENDSKDLIITGEGQCGKTTALIVAVINELSKDVIVTEEIEVDGKVDKVVQTDDNIDTESLSQNNDAKLMVIYLATNDEILKDATELINFLVGNLDMNHKTSVLTSTMYVGEKKKLIEESHMVVRTMAGFFLFLDFFNFKNLKLMIIDGAAAVGYKKMKTDLLEIFNKRILHNNWKFYAASKKLISGTFLNIRDMMHAGYSRIFLGKEEEKTTSKKPAFFNKKFDGC